MQYTYAELDLKTTNISLRIGVLEARSSFWSSLRESWRVLQRLRCRYTPSTRGGVRYPFWSCYHSINVCEKKSQLKFINWDVKCTLTKNNIYFILRGKSYATLFYYFNWKAEYAYYILQCVNIIFLKTKMLLPGCLVCMTLFLLLNLFSVNCIIYIS